MVGYLFSYKIKELYPNMNNKQSCWESEKKKLSEKLKEITLIWRISYEDRNRLISMGIHTWDNPYLLNNLYELKDSNTRDIQEVSILFISPALIASSSIFFVKFTT